MPAFIHIPAPLSSVPAFQYLGTSYFPTAALTHTISGANLGTPHDQRLIIPLSFTPSGIGSASITVGGIAATDTDVSNRTRIQQAAVPTGSTGDIVFTLSASDELAVSWFAGYPLNPAAIYIGSALEGGPGASVPSDMEPTPISVTEGGFMIIGGGRSGATAIYTANWSGTELVTKHTNAALGADSFFSASIPIDTSSSARTMNVDVTNFTSLQAKAVAWGPSH